MSDETSLNKGWSLEAYIAHNEAMRVEIEKRIDEKFVAWDKAVVAALRSAQDAVQKAEAASEKRFESVNEFRATLSDQAATLISRTEVEQALKALDDKVDSVTGRMDRLEGRSGGNHQAWTYGIAILGLLGTLVGIVGTIAAIVVIFTRGG